MTSRSSWGSVSVHLGADAMIRCCTYTDAAPILTLSSDGLSVAVTGAGGDAVSAVDVDNARLLLRAAQTFLAECERLHALASTADAAGPSAAAAAA
ncbi:hypothetical protein [Actinomadura macra]|uniref:hypothetical protein n=1 Tax=Actinomadura macra TaxID=46164 RepID=UPI000835B583|nr:hypothetical protein [Actinomadura macra]